MNSNKDTGEKHRRVGLWVFIDIKCLPYKHSELYLGSIQPVWFYRFTDEELTQLEFDPYLI